MTMRINGKLIHELRIKHSCSQEKLAEIVGVNLRTIQRIESNGVASLNTRAALARAFGLRPEDLDAPEPSPLVAESEASAGRRRGPLLALALSTGLVLLGAAVLAVSITSVTPIGLVTPSAIGGAFVALFGLIILTRLTPLPGWRIYAVLGITILAMVAAPPAWTVQALVAIALWAAFELGILAMALRARHT